jgi:hypothetical protein
MILFQSVAPWVLFVQTAISGVPDVALPDANSNQGQVLVFKVPTTAAATVIRAAPNQFIDAATTKTLQPGETVTIQAQDGKWQVISAITLSGGGGGYNLIQDDGSGLTQFTTLNFTGAAITCADDGGGGSVTVCDVAPAYQTVSDEGTPRPQQPILNFIGAGVSCVDDALGTKTDCTIAGGGGGGNSTEVSINLGTDGGLYYSATVTGQAWVAADSEIVCTPFGTTADGQTVETVAVSAVHATVSDRVVGTGFNLNVYSPHGATGTYRFHCLGV